MGRFNPEDIIVILLATGIFMFLGMITVKGMLTAATISPTRLELLKTLLTSIIAIVSIYIGSKLKN